MHVTAYCETDSMKRLVELGLFLIGNLQQVMNINLRPKKCSGQSRYDKHDSYATVLSKANDCNFHFLSTDLTDFAVTGCNSSITLFTFSTTSTSEVGIAFRPDDKIEGTEVLTVQLRLSSASQTAVNNAGNIFIRDTSTIRVTDTTGN